MLDGQALPAPVSIDEEGGLEVTRWWLIAAALALAAHEARGADAAVATYTATYSVEYKGKEAGTAEFSVVYLADRDLYEFTSRIIAKGLLKLARPKPAVERSQFRVDAEGIRPLEFWYEDGSRSGEDNVHIAFDWDRRVATVSGAETRARDGLTGGRARPRHAASRADARSRASRARRARTRIADEDSVSDYEYTDNGTATTTTGIGPLETRALTQQRAGSSRTTWLWVAPELRFLPVRIEQRRDGEVQTAFTLVAVDGLAASPLTASALRCAAA